MAERATPLLWRCPRCKDLVYIHEQADVTRHMARHGERFP